MHLNLKSWARDYIILLSIAPVLMVPHCFVLGFFVPEKHTGSTFRYYLTWLGDHETSKDRLKINAPFTDN